jgi:hypothetical protein
MHANKLHSTRQILFDLIEGGKGVCLCFNVQGDRVALGLSIVFAFCHRIEQQSMGRAAKECSKFLKLHGKTMVHCHQFGE